MSADLAVVVPSVGRARAGETVASVDASARAAGVSVDIVLAWQASGSAPALPPSARVVEVLPLGVSYAKNRALAGMTAPVIAFVDDDELVDPDWARALLSAFATNPDVGAVFGAIAPLDDRGLAYCRFEGGEERRFEGASTLPWLVGGGGNMAVRLGVLQDIHGFDVLFGPGTAAFCADDTDLVVRLLRAGETILWTPHAVAYHPTKTIEERLASRRPYGFGMGKVVRRHRDVGIAVRYAGYATQSLVTGMVRRDRRRRREAAATLAGFLAGAGTRTPWLPPARLLEFMPEELRGDVDVVDLTPWPVHYRPKPHFVYGLGESRVLHLYSAPTQELRASVCARERIREEAQVDGIPRVLATAEGRDSLWLVEERVRADERNGGVALDAALAWSVAMAKPLGSPVGGLDLWGDLSRTIEQETPPDLRRLVAAALARLATCSAVHSHGDFQQKNVVLSDGRIHVLDWEWARARDLPGGDLLFYALTSSRRPDDEIVATLAAGGEPLSVPLRPFLAEVGLATEAAVRDVLLVFLARWAADERRWFDQLGARMQSSRYAGLLRRCAPVLAESSS